MQLSNRMLATLFLAATLPLSGYSQDAAALQQEIDARREQVLKLITQLEQTIQTGRTELDRLTAQEKAVGEQVADARRRLAQLQGAQAETASRVSLAERVTELEQQLAAARAAAPGNAAADQEVRARIRELTQQVETLLTRLAEQDRQLAAKPSDTAARERLAREAAQREKLVAEADRLNIAFTAVAFRDTPSP